MAKQHKAGFTYIYSDELKQEIALSHKTGRIICEDGTTYSFTEINQIVEQGKKIPLQVHLLKKIFDGEIVL